MVSPTGGVPGSPSSSQPISSGSTGNITPIPLDDIEPSVSELALQTPGPGAPILEEGNIGFLEFAALMAEVTQALKESLAKSQELDFTINIPLYQGVIDQLDAILKLRDEILAEAEEQVKAVEKIEQDVAAAHAELTAAFNAYNATFGADGSNISSVNSAITLYNNLQGMSEADYNSYLANNGGAAAVFGSINNAINTWNAHVAARTTARNDLLQAKANWEATIADANNKLDAINQKREKRDLPLISKYPEPIQTISITNSDPLNYGTYPNVPIGQVGSTLSLAPALQTQGSASGLPSLAPLSNKPTIDEAVELLKTILSLLLGAAGSFLDLIALATERIASDVLSADILGGVRSITLPNAYIDKVPKEFLDTEGGGAGLGLVGSITEGIEDILGNELLKTVVEEFDIPLSPRLIEEFELGALGLLSQSSIASSSAAAQLFGNKLGFIALSSPGAASAIAAAMADTFVSTVASGATRSLVNSALRSEIFAERGKITELSEGQIAALQRQLTAGFNISVLAVTLGLLEKNLGFPGLSLQVLANLSGLSKIDALTAQVGGSQFQAVLNNPVSLVFIKNTLLDTLNYRRGDVSAAQVNEIFNGALNSLGGKFASINLLQGALRREAILQGFSPDDASLLAYETAMLIRGEVGIPGLNDSIGEGKAASALLDTIFAANEGKKDVVTERMRKDREAIEAIIQEEINTSTRSGKFEVNRELRNSLVRSLRDGGYRLGEAQYLSNQVINLMVGNKAAPVTGINGSRLESIRAGAISALAGDFGSKSAALVDDGIQKALAKGPISSEAEFLALVRSELALSGGEGAFDRAIAGASPLKTLSMEELHRELSGHLATLLAPQFGEKQAGVIRDELLSTILGTPSIKDVGDAEKRKPNSLINQIDEQIAELKKQEEEESVKKALGKTTELLQAMMTPNAEMGFVIQSMQDKPTTVISSLAAGQGSVKSGDILGAGPA